MQDEIFTIGGGRFLYNFMGAIAAICQSSQFQSVINATLLASLLWVGFLLAYRPTEWSGLKTWMATSMIVVYALLNVTTTVKITDRLNPTGSTGYIIANVPIGVGKLASITSSIGDEMTRMMEANYADADAPKLRKHGMMFGVRLLANATRMEIKDNAFSNSMSNYIRQCLFYDILLGRKSFDDLKTAADPWAYITSNPAQARMFVIETNSGAVTTKAIKTCAAGVGDLNKRWNGETLAASRRLTLFSNPDALQQSGAAGTRGGWSEGQAQIVMGHVMNDLTSFHQYLIGTSRSAADILKRQMTINAIINEPVDWNSETGNAAGLQSYIDARLALQTRQSYKGIKTQAEQWVPNMKAVFQCVAYAIWPFVVLLMITPMGGAIIRNYIFTFVWIESWGPLTAVMNYIVNSKAQNQMMAHVHAAGSSATDIQLIAQSGIQAVEADISVMAGYLMMSVPFISLALVSIGRMAMLSQSIMGPTQEAIGDTSRETATGNLSIGNTGHDNHNAHNYNGFNRNLSPSVNTEQSSVVAASGATITETGDGRMVLGAGSQSILPTNITGNTNMAETFSQARDESLRAANDNNVGLQNSQSASWGLSNSFSDAVTKGNSSDFAYGNDESFKASEDISTVKSAAQSWGETHGFKENELVSAAANLNVGGGVSIGGEKSMLSGSARLEAQAKYDANNSTNISYDDAMKFASSEDVRDSLGRLTNASISEKASWNTGESESFAEAQQANYQDIKNYSEGQSASLQRAEQMGTAASLVQSSSSAINSDLNQPFVEWLQTQPSMQGEGNMSVREAETLLNSKNLEDRTITKGLANQFLDEGGYRAISDPRIVAAFENINPEQKFGQDSTRIENEADIEGQAMTNAGRIASGDGVRAQNQTNSQNVVTKTEGQMNEVGNEIQEKRDNTEEEIETGAYRVSNERNKTISDQAGHVAGQLGDAGGEVVDATKEAFQDWRDGNAEPTSDPIAPEDYVPVGGAMESGLAPKTAHGMGQRHYFQKDE